MIIRHIFSSERWPDYRTGCRSQEECERLLRYLNRAAAKPEILWNDFASESVDVTDGIAAYMAMIHRGQKIWAYHITAAHPKGEGHLWDPQAQQCIAELHERCGIDKALWVKHDDHWHGFLMALRPKGGTIRLGSYDSEGNRLNVAQTFRKLAEDWEDRTPGCQKTNRGGPHSPHIGRGSMEMAERQYLAKEEPTPIPKKLLLKAKIDRIVALSADFNQLHAHAQQAGIEVKYKKDAVGKVLGISFAGEGVSLRGREAGYSYNALQLLYANPSTQNTDPTNLRRHSPMAGRTLGQDRRESFQQTPTVHRQAERDAGENRRVATEAGNRNAFHDGWIEKAVRALTPHTDFIDLIVTLTDCLSTIARQTDYRRRNFPTPEIPR